MQSGPCWFVGAVIRNKDHTQREDRTAHFFTEGIWEHGFENSRVLEQVRSMVVGERIAIKTACTRKQFLLQQPPPQRFFTDLGRRSLRVFISALAYAAISATLGHARPGGLTEALLGEWRLRLDQIDAHLHGVRLRRQQEDAPANPLGEEKVTPAEDDDTTDHTSMVP